MCFPEILQLKKIINGVEEEARYNASFVLFLDKHVSMWPWSNSFDFWANFSNLGTGQDAARTLDGS